MQYAIALLDKASDRCNGNDSAVARLVGITPQSIHDIRRGKLKMSPETAAILAAAIGDDPEYAVKRVMLDNAKGDRLARLQKAFRVAAGVAGAAVLAGMAAAPSPSSAGTIKTARDLPHTLDACTDYTLSRLNNLATSGNAGPARRSGH